MTFPEIFFYAEAEGLLPTRAGIINAVIKDLNKDPNANFNEILRKHDLSYEELTERELRHIIAQVEN